ncbi:MAG TPA: biotin/lipoyl-binding protein [Solirubrobacteraceae bacterium]|jgi:multidrug efflux pump subunit AcrA (membrane-fusion protein)|nr:biotin/lipoyl-binding protein [Solirubrobacteraceae bacterium]
MTERTGRPWLNYLMGLLCVGAIVAAILVVGPASGSQPPARTAKAALGVVQSTVSGSGNLQPASQLNLGFKTSGTVTHIYVTQGELVTEGRLLAELDPSTAEVTSEQARATLLSAKANLAAEEETGGEGSGGSKNASAKATPRGNGKQSSPRSTSRGSTVSAATREANLASARAAVKSDELAVGADEQAVAHTKLYAPETGTIVTLSGQVGEVVSASGTSRASSGSPSSSGSGSAGGASSGRGAGAGSTGTTGSSSSAASSGFSSTAFAVLSDLSSMDLVVALGESEIGHVKVGQIATVTVEALEDRALKGAPSGAYAEGHPLPGAGGQAGKLAAHVSEVATLSTTSSGVVSYDVTFRLDQMQAGLKPGMSATAEVVVKQAEGVNVPTSAISAGSVTVVRGGKDVRQPVVTGLAGNGSTILLNGVKAGETVVLPAARSTSSATSLTSRLGRLGGGGGLGAGGGFAGGGGAAFFRGGG